MELGRFTTLRVE